MPTFSRRGVIAPLAATGLAALWPGRAWPLPTSGPDNGFAREGIESLVRRHFVSADPAMMSLAVEVYRSCVLGKVRPAEPPFHHPWLVPGGVYQAQWIWDTMFVGDLLSILPEQRDTIRGIFQNFWDFQTRWAAVKPDFAHGFIANYIAPDSGPSRLTGKTWATFPAFSQAPLLAWGMERVFVRNRDIELVRTGVGPLEAYHDWYWRERDLHLNGLVCVGSYSGDAQDARYETYDHEVDLDGLTMTAHPTRKRLDDGQWYGDICIPANTAYLLLSEASLIRLAEACGDHALAERRKPFLARGIDAMRKHMWSERRGCFLAVNRDTLDRIDTPTVGGFVPLMAGVPTSAQAARMAVTLSSPDWATPLPVPTVARSDKSYRSDQFWRGDVWPAPNYQIASGLRDYGHANLAAEVADKLVGNALRVGLNERYDSQTGTPLGVAHLGMSGVVLTVALDGLTARHRIAIAA